MTTRASGSDSASAHTGHQFADTTRRERIVLRASVEGEASHRSDPFDQDGRLTRAGRIGHHRPPIGWLSPSADGSVSEALLPGSSSRTTTFPAALRGKASTMCRLRGTL